MFTEELTNYLKARYPLILIKTTEEDRLKRDIDKIATSENFDVFIWSVASGLTGTYKSFEKDTTNLGTAIDNCEKIAQTSRRAIFVFYDVEPALKLPTGILWARRLKEFAVNIRTYGYECNCILVSNKAEIHESIDSEITVLDYPLPTRAEIKDQIKKFMASYKNVAGIKIDSSVATVTALTDASLGLTSAEIENCLSRALVEDHRLDISDVKSIVNEKKQIIRKSGILEYIENQLSLDDVGGLSVLKKWLQLKGLTFSEDAQKFGLTAPQGVLLVGIPGCGKSLTAKCVATSWNMPLLKFDMGKIFGKYVGESEANLRQALKTAEAIAPCVLWIDEIEKGLSVGANDGGTSSRVFGNILTWMQERTAPVFTFATANNISNLPSELLRKGRFDEIFFVDLPDFEERKKILEIHIKKLKRDLNNFDLDELARLSGEKNWENNVRLSGAELEAWVKDSLMEAFSRRALNKSTDDLSMKDFQTVIQRMVPMAKLRLDDFKRLREWANEHAISASATASSETGTNTLGGRRLDLV